MKEERRAIERDREGGGGRGGERESARERESLSGTILRNREPFYNLNYFHNVEYNDCRLVHRASLEGISL